jgi:hypothetical protein
MMPPQLNKPAIARWQKPTEPKKWEVQLCSCKQPFVKRAGQTACRRCIELQISEKITRFQ